MVLVNNSDAIARNVKYAMALWNLDLPARNDPLPIAIGTFDWIKAREQSGPTSFLTDPSVATLLHSGNRLFGTASITCPECGRGRTYAIYIVWSQGGWLSEIGPERQGRLVVPSDFSRTTREIFFKNLKQRIPTSARMGIAER